MKLAEHGTHCIRFQHELFYACPLILTATINNRVGIINKTTELTLTRTNVRYFEFYAMNGLSAPPPIAVKERYFCSIISAIPSSRAL